MIQKSPSDAINYLNHIVSNLQLTDAEDDTIQEWISVSREWIKFGTSVVKVNSKEDLFHLGEKYYKRGISKMSYLKDSKGKADLYIATTYLVSYIYKYDGSKNIGQALLMLGNIKQKSWNDYEYWTENFYLKEVIRRFPHTTLARTAYKNLEAEIHNGYTGSAGDSTPPSQIKTLKEFKILASPNK